MARRSETSNAAELLERSARFWLRAYPRRWRVAFGDDFVRVLAEVSEPGTVRVPAREAGAIVKGGWSLRLREHPPLLRWLGYRFLDLRLPLRYQHWVVDDILGRFWGARSMSSALILWVVIGLNLFVTGDSKALVGYVGFMAVLSVGFLLLLAGPFGTSKRRAAWQRYISPEVPPILLSRRDRAREQARDSHAARDPNGASAN